MGHAIGFYHEQSKPDRVNFVTINYNNIEVTKELNFQSHSDTLINILTVFVTIIPQVCSIVQL